MKIMNGVYDIPDNINVGAKLLLGNMMNVNFNERASAQEVYIFNEIFYNFEFLGFVEYLDLSCKY